MVRKRLEDVVVGSVLAEPIYSNNVLICKKGMPISETLKNSLPKFGINEVCVDSIVTDSIDLRITNFDDMQRISYSIIKSLDIDSLMLCCRSLVQNIIDNVDDKFIDVLYEYDEGTYQHSINVANFAVAVGVSLNLSIDKLKTLALGSLLHDIGKTGIPKEIINKNGKLTDEEYNTVKEHPWIGYKLVCDSYEISSAVKQIVYQHHENYDGTGYPRKLGRTLSYKLARLVHICDVYEALCAERPYKKDIPRRAVRDIMESASGTQFDPYLLKVFMDTVPLYLIGETVKSDGRIGIVINTKNKDNPDIFCDGAIVTLDKFEVTDKYDTSILHYVI